jgi:hypothetical protein
MNTTTVCEVSELSPFAALYFDEECSRAQDVDCPLDVVEGFVTAFAGENRILVHMLNLLTLFFIIGSARLAPVPRPTTLLGLLALVVWVCVTLLQWLLSALSFAVVCVVYAVVQGSLGVCMRPLRPGSDDGYKLLDAVVLATFPLQPAFYMKFLLILIHGILLHYGIGTKIIKQFFKVITYTLGIAYGASLAIAIIVWLLSLSAIIGMVFLPISLINIMVTLLVVFLVVIVYLISDELGVSWLANKLNKASGNLLEGRENENVTTMEIFLLGALGIMTLSPLLAVGTSYTIYLYGALPPEPESTATLRIFYSYLGEGFVPFFIPPFLFSWDFANINLMAIVEFVDGMVSWASRDVIILLEGSRALGSLTLILSLIKPATLYGLGLLKMFELLITCCARVDGEEKPDKPGWKMVEWLFVLDADDIGEKEASGGLDA